MTVVNGTAANDVLVGTNNDATLNGPTGADKMASRAGNDLFRYLLDNPNDLPVLGGELITGFDIGKDKIDVFDPFVDFDVASRDIVNDGVLRLLFNGNDTLLPSDKDGGNSYVTLASLQNVTNTTIADVIFHPGELE